MYSSADITAGEYSTTRRCRVDCLYRVMIAARTYQRQTEVRRVGDEIESVHYIVHDQGESFMPEAEINSQGLEGKEADQEGQIARDDVESDLDTGCIGVSIDLAYK